MAIITEPHGPANVMTVHGGVVNIAVHTIGKSRHTSRRQGSVDAIDKMRKAIPAIRGVEFTCERRADLPALPLVNIGVIMGGMGRDYDLKGPNFVSDFCTVLVDVRFLPGMSSESVVADLDRALSALSDEDPDFVYEIEVPAPPVFKANKVVMEPFDLPRGEYIVEAVARQVRTVTGREPDNVGVVLPNSYTGNDSCHLWRAGVPCVADRPGRYPGVAGRPGRVRAYKRDGAGGPGARANRAGRVQPAQVGGATALRRGGRLVWRITI